MQPRVPVGVAVCNPELVCPAEIIVFILLPQMPCRRCFHHHIGACLVQRYRDLVGAECPVMASIPHGEAHIEWLSVQLRKSLDVARECDRKAREQIAQELGHNRIDVTNAYLG